MHLIVLECTGFLACGSRGMSERRSEKIAKGLEVHAATAEYPGRVVASAQKFEILTILTPSNPCMGGLERARHCKKRPARLPPLQGPAPRTAKFAKKCQKNVSRQGLTALIALALSITFSIPFYTIYP